MKTLAITLVLILITLTSMKGFATNGAPLQIYKAIPSNSQVGSVEPFRLYENVALFPGGDLALQKYIQRNMNYPLIAKQQGIEGKVIISMVIDEFGSVCDIEIIQGIGGGCEEEVIRVLLSMPDWKPTIQAGHYIKTRKLFSFDFQFS